MCYPSLSMPQDLIHVTPTSKPECLFPPQWANDVTEQLNLLEEKMNHILNDLHGNLPIIPELAAAVRRNSIFARHIDRQVPDDPAHRSTSTERKN